MNDYELFELIEENDELSEFKIVSDLNATYFVTKEGTQIGFGYLPGCGRLNDHRIIFGLTGIERNNFKALIEETELLVYMPEGNEALWLDDLELSPQQETFLQENGVELMLE